MSEDASTPNIRLSSTIQEAEPFGLVVLKPIGVTTNAPTPG